MAKNYSHGKKTRKSLIAMLCALSVTCTGLAAACTPTEDDEDDKKPAKEDTQLLKNGNFEYFTVPDDAVYLINNVTDWTRGGDSSVMSGIVGTSNAAWDALTADDLADKLDTNNGLSSSDDDYVDYNSMHSRDIFYKDPYSALLTATNFNDDKIIKNQGYQEYFGIEGSDADGYTLNGEPVYRGKEDDKQFYFDEELTKPVRKELISNPETHYGEETEKDGKYYLGDKEVYKDDDGNLYEDEDKKNSVGNVLMVHNYATDGKYNGIQQYYTSATVNLEANTAAEISLWVKTSDLKFDKGYSALDEQDKGAYIEVIQTVSSTTLDSFVVKNINTEKIIKYAADDQVTLGENESNGWLKYNIYVNACDFAASTVQIRLGLGQAGDEEKCTGYAFFDDVQVTKYRNLTDSESYKESAAAGKLDNTTSTLTTEAENKIYNADKELRSASDEVRHPYDFHYAIDLASSTGANQYKSIVLGSGNVNSALTAQEEGSKNYASAATNEAKLTNVTKNDKDGYDLVKDVDPRPTSGDIVGAFAKDHVFSAADFNAGATDYSSILNDALKKGVPNQTGNTLVTLSAWGAAYTSTVTDESFKVTANDYRIVSFWLKTSDMSGKTAATVKLYAVDADGKPVKDNQQSLTIDTTGVTTDFEGEKDIYNGWTQCFFFVKNENDGEAEFKIDVSFGNTTIKDATAYNGGWIAFADLQTLIIDEDVYKMASAGTYTGVFEFNEAQKDAEGNKMDEASGTSDIKKGISTPTNYNGVNGGNSSVTGGESRPSFDGSNTHSYAGLINKEHAEEYADWSLIAGSFLSADKKWNEVFGDECYQPLIIINNGIRTYVEKKEADADTYQNYYVLAKEGDEVAFTTADGKKYAKATSYDEDTDYYTPSEAFNYGFTGSNKNVAANSYETVSVKVKVSAGATAYVYLVDADDPSKVLSYNTPTLTFHYDVEGNVLKEEYDADWKEDEHRKNIVYTLRDDGLYEDKDGKVFANLNNLIKNYKNYKFEHETFYNEDGVSVSFDALVNGENYYTSADKKTFANHYLVNTAGTRIYEYDDGKYYYLEEGKKTTEVNNFDEEYARYNYESIGEEYAVKVTDTKGEWVTVNFFLHTGSAAKNYRLELWYGERGETGIGENGAVSTGAVAFDYSAYSVTSENYSTVIGEYETNVINAYKELLKDDLSVIDSEDANIAFYESKLTEEQIKSVKDKFNYTAKYYTYTLYDAESYLPFNANTAADGETGYEYKITDFDETLAYFRYDNEKENSYNVFVDYSAVDQDIKINTSTDGDEDEEEEDTNTSGDVWLYVSSIILVAVLLLTLAAMLLRSYLKKHNLKNAKNKLGKNKYRQRDRYVRKLHLVKNEEAEDTTETAEATEEGTTETVETVEEVTETEEVTQEVTETVEENETVEEPAETTEVTEEKPDDGENN